jgi:hypothetical protein
MSEIPNYFINQGNPGSHWSALFVGERGRAEFFDSYKLNPSPDHKKFLKRFKGTKLSMRPLQSVTSETCGKFCIFYLACRMGGYSPRHFYNCFGGNPRRNDQIITEVLQMF